MKVIPLTQGLFTKVDDADYERLFNFGKWYAIKNKRTFYAATAVNNRTVFMHNLIMGSINNVDHKDRDGLNNQRENLRLATKSQSSMNRGTPRNNTSGYKGVSLFYYNQKWAASIKENGKRHHLGYFDTKEQAALAYNEAAIKYHGEFAVLNQIEQEPKTHDENRCGVGTN